MLNTYKDESKLTCNNDEQRIIMQCKQCINRCLVSVITTENTYVYSGGLCNKTHFERRLQ